MSGKIEYVPLAEIFLDPEESTTRPCYPRSRPVAG